MRVVVLMRYMVFKINDEDGKWHSDPPADCLGAGWDSLQNLIDYYAAQGWRVHTVSEHTLLFEADSFGLPGHSD